ncbi:MAG: DUF1177 family protein [Gemmatimonadaceae bacterium]
MRAKWIIAPMRCSIDTTKGNRVLNAKGFALSPTVKEG